MNISDIFCIYHNMYIKMHIQNFKIYHFNWFECCIKVYYILNLNYFRFFKDGLNCSISTDDPGIMLITIFDDYTEVKNRMGLSIKNIQQMVDTDFNPAPTLCPPNQNPIPVGYWVIYPNSGLKYKNSFRTSMRPDRAFFQILKSPSWFQDWNYHMPNSIKTKKQKKCSK